MRAWVTSMCSFASRSAFDSSASGGSSENSRRGLAADARSAPRRRRRRFRHPSSRGFDRSSGTRAAGGLARELRDRASSRDRSRSPAPEPRRPAGSGRETGARVCVDGSPRIPALEGSPLLERRRWWRSHDQTREAPHGAGHLSSARRPGGYIGPAGHRRVRRVEHRLGPRRNQGRVERDGDRHGHGEARSVGCEREHETKGTTPAGKAGNPLLVRAMAIGVTAESAPGGITTCAPDGPVTVPPAGPMPNPDDCPGVRSPPPQPQTTRIVETATTHLRDIASSMRHLGKQGRKPVRKPDIPGQAGDFPHLTSRTRIAGLSPLREWASQDSISTAV